MSDEIGFEHRAGCPECGANLGTAKIGIEPSPDDMLFCVTCGFEIKREAFREQSLGAVDPDQVRDSVGEHIDKAMREMIKGTGFTLE